MDNSESGGNREGLMRGNDATFDFETAFAGENMPIAGENNHDGESVEDVEIVNSPIVEEIEPASEKKETNINDKTKRGLGKVGTTASLMGDKLDEEGISAEVKRIKELPSLYEQSAARDEIVAQFMPQDDGGAA